MRKIYCFDFDGTLTQRDTMFLFLKFYHPSRYRIQFLKYIPVFVLLKLGLLSADKVKKNFIFSVIKKDSKTKIEQTATAFFQHYYPSLIRENAMNFINEIDTTKVKCYLVTASLDIWVKPFAKKWGMTLISTKAAFSDDKFTGQFVGKNCNGEEKVNRLKKALEGVKYDKIVAFGDTDGDQPMLKWADKGYYKYFH